MCVAAGEGKQHQTKAGPAWSTVFGELFSDVCCGAGKQGLTMKPDAANAT